MIPPSPRKRSRLHADLLAWYARHRRDLPWRASRDPYAIWISEAMLQQTRVEVVLGYWPRFLERFPSAEALAAASEEDLLASWSGLGYYRRARSLQAAAREIVLRHGGAFPRTRQEALALPGIGPYTAGAVLSIAFGLSEALVDGNVERVLARLFELDDPRGSTALSRSTWEIARSLVPNASSAARAADTADTADTADESGPGTWNQALMELGALVCTPRNPSCGVCPLAGSCAGRRAGRQEELPRRRPRPNPIDVQLESYWAERDGRVLLVQRPADGMMGGLWELPTVELAPVGTPERLYGATLPEESGFSLEPQQDLFGLRHTITRHRIRIRVRLAEVSGAPPPPYRWVQESGAAELGLTGMARKVLTRRARARESARETGSSSPGGLFAE